MTSDAYQPPPTKGFEVSTRRTFMELGAVVLALVLAGWALFSAAAWLAVTALPLIPVALDVTIGEASWGSLAPEETRCTDPATLAYIEEIAAPLLAALPDDRFTFNFTVVDDDAINAFALPGGFVTVNFGLLKEAETGEEVAAVLAHEIYHVTERHGFQRILRKLSGYMAIGVVLGWMDLQILTALTADLVSTGYDRDQERESDTLGRELLLRAHIKPDGMTAFFGRLEAKHGSGDGFMGAFTSHPGSAERARTAAKGQKLTGPAIELPSPEGLRCHMQ